MANLSDYTPARLVKGKAWYVVYYQTNPLTNKLERHRESHNLNRIHSKKVRRQRANEILNQINAQLPYGYPYNLTEETATLTLKLTPILDAIDKALDLKLATLNRPSSAKGYKGKVNFFKIFIEKKKLHSLKIGEWSSVHTNDFMNFLLLKKKPSSVTHNDYVRQLRGLFDILLDQHYIKNNHFANIDKRKEVPTKIRKRFKEKTRRAMIEEINKVNDQWFMLSIILQYYFFLRPVEISRLKVGDVDLDEWRVELPSTAHKTYKERSLIIPEVAKQYFPNAINDLPDNFYLIGSGVKPGLKCIDKNGMYRRNLKYLKMIEKRGFDITGLSFYSWKNSGGYDMLNKNEKISVFDVQDRMGHSDIKTTKRYVLANDKNAEYIRNKI